MDYYAPIQRSLSSISGLIERGAERRSRHDVDMAQLGLMDRRLGIEKERLDMERDRQGLALEGLAMDVKEKRRLLAEQEQERQRLNMPSNLNDVNKLSEFVGVAPFNQGNEFWVSYFADVIPKSKHRHDDPENPEKITGFDVKKGEVAQVVNRVLARVAETDPANLIGIRAGYRDLQQYLVGELGAKVDGKDKASAQLRLAQNETQRLDAHIQAFNESPVAGLASIMVLRGENAIKNPEYRKLAKAYMNTLATKGSGVMTAKDVLDYRENREKAVNTQIKTLMEEGLIEPGSEDAVRQQLYQKYDQEVGAGIIPGAGTGKTTSQAPTLLDTLRELRAAGIEKEDAKNILIEKGFLKPGKKEAKAAPAAAAKPAVESKRKPVDEVTAMKLLRAAQKSGRIPQRDDKAWKEKLKAFRGDVWRLIEAEERAFAAFEGVRTRGKQQIQQSLSAVGKKVRETVRKPEAEAKPWYAK